MSNKTPENHAEKTASALSFQKTQIVLFVFLAISVLFFAVAIFGLLRDDTVTINNQKITVTVADSSEEREQGLSGRERLAANEGMLFKYSNADIFCMWMKDMKFPIDIIWLDENKKVVTIKENATPESYPESFCPAKPAKYVLEINAGQAQQKNIKLDSQASF